MNPDSLNADSHPKMTISPYESSRKKGRDWKDYEYDDDEEEEEEEEEEIVEGLQGPADVDYPTPPDGGWGWVVVFASFMIHVFADGFTYTFGLFYVQILDYYKCSKSACSWIVSILVGVTLGSGPISGTLVNKFGCRVVTIAGAILASIALFVSIYAPNVIYLYITIGMLTGLGFGLIYLPAIVCVTGYFEKRRSFATGIAVCGSGIGTFIFSPLIEYLIATYSWKGALIILSGILSNCIVFGSLFRPLNVYRPRRELYRVSSNDVVNLADTPRIEIATENGDLKSVYCETAFSRRLNTGNDFERISSHGNFNPLVQSLKDSETTRMTVSQPLLRVPEQESSFSSIYRSDLMTLRNRASLPCSRSGSGLLYRKDIFYRGSLTNIPEYKQDPCSYRASMLIFPEVEEATSKTEKSKKLCACISCSRETRDAISSLMDWGLLSDGVFLLFSVSNFCTSIGFNAPYIFIVDRALEAGMDAERASYLLSVIGISNTVSRVLLGYISDKSWVNRLYLYNVALTVCGAATCFSIWMESFPWQCIYAAMFGSTSGAYVGLTSVVLVDLLGMERLTNAFGLLLLFQGIASLIGPPLCGALYDWTGTYTWSFILSGSMIASSGLILFFIPFVIKVQEIKHNPPHIVVT